MIITGAASLPSAAQASDLGALLGITWGNNNIGGHLAWGLTGHTVIMPNIQLGAYLSEISNDTTVLSGVPGATVTNHFWTIAGEGNYLLTDLVNGAWVGAKAGIEVISTSVINASNTTDFVIGPAVGYDYPIGAGFTAGGQFNVLFVTSSPSTTLTSLLAALKYNF